MEDPQIEDNLNAKQKFKKRKSVIKRKSSLFKISSKMLKEGSPFNTILTQAQKGGQHQSNYEESLKDNYLKTESGKDSIEKRPQTE